MADLDLGLAGLRGAAAASGAAAMVELTVAEVRERIRDGDRLCADGPEVPTEDRLLGDGPSVPARIYGPTQPSAVLVYAHGGGWVTGDLGYADEICRFLARDAGCTVISVDYRLAPEHRFPAGLEDVLAATRWALATYRDIPVGIAGDSAGANLAAVVTHELRAEIAFSVLAYPVTDHDLERPSYRECAWPIGRADMEWFFDHYVDTEQRPHRRVSPIRAEDLSGIPPTHVLVAGYDPLHDEGLAYATRLRDAGATVSVAEHPDLCHGFLRFTALSEGARAARTALVRTVASLVHQSVSDPDMLSKRAIPAYDLPQLPLPTLDQPSH